jgi:histidine ammonia-lyase
MGGIVLLLNGRDLKVRDIALFVERDDITVEVSRDTLVRVDRARRFVDRTLGERVVYGVNTGFGPMASHVIGEEHLVELQHNLVRSHACGMGEPVSSRHVLAAMLARLNTLVQGYSGVSRELIARFVRHTSERIIPVVPRHGAVGTSGDLVQLAHIALALIGEGDVFYEGARQRARTALSEFGIGPYQLKPKEGLSLINGTSFMTGVGALVICDTERLLSLTIRAGALSLELLDAYRDGISETLHVVRPHPGQGAVARMLRELTEASGLLRDRAGLHDNGVGGVVHEIDDGVQEVYSVRCIPQIVGPALDTFLSARACVEVELNSVTDNPLVDCEAQEFLHGGNFHGEYVAGAMDELRAALAKLAMLSERRVNFFVNHKTNRRFPPFLNLSKPGLTLGLQALQLVATSTVANMQTLAFPQRVHSIPTNEDNQDVVSMGADSALMTAETVYGAYIVLAIELVTLAQAVDVRKVRDRLSPEGRKLYGMVRAIFPTVVEDRVMDNELAKLVDFLKRDSGLLLKL